MSGTALKIVIDPATSDILLHNLNKNTILVDRLPVLHNQKASINHMSLIQLSSEDIFFFLLPHEAIDKKKRYIKEKRKDLERINYILNPYKNQFDVKGDIVKKIWDKEKEIKEKEAQSFGKLVGEFERRRVGLGKRLTMTEMLRLQKNTKLECIRQMGMGFLPKGTKAFRKS